MKKGIHLFTPQRMKMWLREDYYLNPQNTSKEAVSFRNNWKKFNTQATVYKGAVVFKNYIPLFRWERDIDSFNEAQPNTLYIWNFYDLSVTKFRQVVKDIKQLPEVKGMKIEVSEDPAGF